MQLRELFSEPDDKLSFGRVGSALALLCCLLWDTYLVFSKQAIPELAGQALFIGTLYGLNKATTAAVDAISATRKA